MRNPHQRTRTRLVRRVLSHHGSDCSLDCCVLKGELLQTIRWNRCIILTRVDYADGRPSVAWVSGDWSESRRLKYKYHTFDPSLPVWYGGGFWDRVQIDPLPKGVDL